MLSVKGTINNLICIPDFSFKGLRNVSVLLLLYFDPVQIDRKTDVFYFDTSCPPSYQGVSRSL